MGHILEEVVHTLAEEVGHILVLVGHIPEREVVHNLDLVEVDTDILVQEDTLVDL